MDWQNVKNLEILLKTRPEQYWIGRGKRMAKGLFGKAAVRVPAYARFLRANMTHTGKSYTDAFWDKIPCISKDTYLRKYPLPDVCWDGKLTEKQMIISATSGSTGEPFYFPRTHTQDIQYAAVAELYLRTNFSIQKKRTLYIIGWGMGIWIGGVFSYAAVRLVAERGKYALSVITPGSNAEEILQVVKRLGPLYDQVIIGGYPPMVKDLVDMGTQRKLNWKRYNVKFIFSAEGFSEAFRDYIAEHTGLTNIYKDTLNHYGTVDFGTMAHETPVSILIRRLAGNNTGLNQELFGHEHRQPTLAQYIPELFFFEEIHGSLVCSGYAGVPLVRYDLIDTGGVKTFAKTADICRAHGVHLAKEIRKAGISDTVWNLPFVYVFERRDFTVKLSGANIFPQEIRRALELPQAEPYVTGRFTMQVSPDASFNQSLTVHVELRSHVRASDKLASVFSCLIVEILQKHNSEYAYLSTVLPKERLIPKIDLVSYGSGIFFSRKGKQKWVST